MAKTRVMVNGLPGKMASEVANSIVLLGPESGLELIEYSLTGPEIADATFTSDRWPPIEAIKPEQREERIEQIKAQEGRFISVDFAADVTKTQPGLPNEQAEFYCRNGLPFVMGATGGDRKALEERVRNSETAAVIAPNMAKQIVALQALIEDFASKHPNYLSGCQLRIRESHQKGKVDTSGTAKAMVGYFNKLGIPFKPEEIEMIRDPQVQLQLGIPSEHLAGHGWHTYSLLARDMRQYEALSDFWSVLDEFMYVDDGKVFQGYGLSAFDRTSKHNNTRRRLANGIVTFDVDKHGDEEKATLNVEISHKVNGRDIYARGTLDAIRFLDRRIKEGSRGQVYSMIDVLRGN